MQTAGSQQWDTSLAIQALTACNLTDEIGATLMKGHDFIKKSQVLSLISQIISFYHPSLFLDAT